jgi:NAD(P)-dependent dehydrogenase (short-subunit alcohol dehydrogenase family)
MTGFTDKGIVVTGAARGMGLAIAARFHESASGPITG